MSASFLAGRAGAVDFPVLSILNGGGWIAAESQPDETNKAFARYNAGMVTSIRQAGQPA
jgi:hypothetical protein